jgi:hypothetical protein
MSEWIKNTGVKPYTGVSNFEVKLRSDVILNSSEALFGDFDWSLEDNAADIIEWRFTNTDTKQNEIARSASLSQGEVQQLLHELRDTLSMVTEIKNEYKREAQRLWNLCDKEDFTTSGHFEDFSLSRKFFLQHKKREARLSNLIKQIKGLQ